MRGKLEIKNYRADDLELYFEFQEDARAFGPVERYCSREALRESLNEPGYRPERDLIIAKDMHGMALAKIRFEPAIGRALMFFLLSPSGIDERSIVQELVRACEKSVSGVGAKFMQTGIWESEVAAQSLFSYLRFRRVRRYLDLVLALSGEIPDCRVDVSYEARPLRKGEEASLTELQNASFTGSWGFNPNRVEDISWRLGLRRSRYEDVIVVARRDELAAYCWATVNRDDCPGGVRKGGIRMMGVRPEFRGQGLGRFVLCQGLARLRSESVEVAELTVDEENSTARSLYESVGFHFFRGSLWYQKEV